MATSATRSDVRVPFVDLAPSHAPVAEAILADVAGLVSSGAFTNGPQVAAFEAEFAAYCGVDHCIGLASGLDALRLALLALGIRPGDEVLVPADTFIATFEAVSQAGGVPVPVEVSERDYNLDPEAVEAAVSARTGFLLPVHLYGQLSDMRALLEVAARHELRIVEDACQAHGATRDGIRAGASGHAAAFSFYPSKNLGAFGDAGALVTPDGDLAEQVRALREHGQRAKYRHELEGYTARLDTIQAIALSHKLPLLDAWNAERRAQAGFYSERLDGVGDLVLPPVAPKSEPVWHLYPIRTAEPDRLAEFLKERSIGTSRHYPEPAHLSAAYAHLGHKAGSFPVAEAIARECLSLPVFPGMREEQLEATAAAVEAFFRDGA
ncbi:MAG TPA: DegT/DnrJ/EryC1/StrS family aminotransferase [Gaiellaceae bacterium]